MPDTQRLLLKGIDTLVTMVDGEPPLTGVDLLIEKGRISAIGRDLVVEPDDDLRVIDGANINLKSFSDRIYRQLNGARLDPVLNTFKTLYAQGVHFEMTNLVVPGYVDDPDMVKRMCGWILENLGPDHPLHFSRFFPQYKLDRLAPTPVSVLEEFREIALQAGIRYVYLGNVPGHASNDTHCHHCKKILIRRRGYQIAEYSLQDGTCKYCGTKIPGIW